MEYGSTDNGTTLMFIFLFCAEAIISSVAFILYFSNYGSFVKSEFILQFRLDTKIKEHHDFIKIIKSYTSTHTLLSSESSDDGKSLKNSYILKA